MRENRNRFDVTVLEILCISTPLYISTHKGICRLILSLNVYAIEVWKDMYQSGYQ